MNERMVEAWNAVVLPTDEVWYLGDFSLSKKALVYVARLNGVKHLVPGNHDHCFPFNNRTRAALDRSKKQYLDAGFATIAESPVVTEIGGESVRLWHLPYATPAGDHAPYELRYLEYRPQDDGMWLLCGHVHNAWRINGRMINVGVDAWGMRPVSEQEVSDIITNPPRVALTVFDHVD